MEVKTNEKKFVPITIILETEEEAMSVCLAVSNEYRSMRNRLCRLSPECGDTNEDTIETLRTKSDVLNVLAGKLNLLLPYCRGYWERR